MQVVIIPGIHDPTSTKQKNKNEGNYFNSEMLSFYNIKRNNPEFLSQKHSEDNDHTDQLSDFHQSCQGKEHHRSYKCPCFTIFVILVEEIPGNESDGQGGGVGKKIVTVINQNGTGKNEHYQKYRENRIG
jgi:hypothetical protein